MRARPALRAGLALAAALVGVGGAAAVAATPAPYTTRDAQVRVTDGPGGSHHATLDTRTYIPRGASAAHPVPAVVMTNGFGQSKTDPQVVRWAQFLAAHGYLVLTWTAQGFGHSSGCIQLDDVSYDVRDASELITALVAPRRDVRHDRLGPVVGMVGTSYAGGLLPMVAEFDRRVRAIAPIWAWNSLQHALMPNDWVPAGTPATDLATTADGVPKAEWTTLLYADGNAQPAQGNGGCPQEKAAAGDPGAASCPGFADAMCTAFAQVMTTGSLDPATRSLLARSSGATWIARLRTPTLLVQGERDTLFNLDEAIATYTALHRAGVPVKMIWTSTGHGGYPPQPGEGDLSAGSLDADHGYVSLSVLAWFDHYLKGRPVPTGPGFAFYEPWRPAVGSGDDHTQYGAAAGYPAEPGARFLLSGGPLNSGVLIPPQLTPSPGSFSFARAGVPAYSETSDCTGPAAGPPCPPGLAGIAPQEVPGETATWTSPALPADVVSVGMPTAHLHVSHLVGTDVIFFAKVYDVAPDGTATLVDRLVAPVRVPDAALSRAVDIRLPAFAWRFDRGHQVRFVLAAADAAYDAGVTTNVPDVVTVSFGNPPPPPNATPYQQIQSLEADPDASSFTLPVDNPAKTEPYYGTP